MSAVEALGVVVVAVCAPIVALLVVVGLAWTIEKGDVMWIDEAQEIDPLEGDELLAGIAAIERGRRHRVATSQNVEAQHESAGRATPGAGAAAAALHGLPARRHDRHAVAARAPHPSEQGRTDDDHELRSVAPVLPMVQAGVQPVRGRQAGRGEDERQARGDEQSSSRPAQMVTPRGQEA